MATQMMNAARPKPLPAVLPTTKPPSDSVIDALAVEDQVLLTKLLTEPTDYVDHPDFPETSTERKLFGENAKLTGRSATRFIEHPDPITDAATAGERVPALSHEQEKHLFMRFNFARMQVARVLADHSGTKLSAAATRRLLAWGHRILTTRSVIVRLNMPLVLAMAKRTRLTNIDFNEMISEGNMALLRSSLDIIGNN